MSTLEAHGITDYDHSGRKVSRRCVDSYHQTAHSSLTMDGMQFLSRDFEKFDYIFAMDRSNLVNLKRLQHKQRDNADAKAQVMLFGEFGGGKEAEVVRDPYYGGSDGFELAFEQCKRFAGNFLRDVVLKEGDGQ